MTYPRPTDVSFFRAVWLCSLALFAPKKFLNVQEDDNRALKKLNEGTKNEPGIFAVRRAFCYSFLLVLASGVAGYLAGTFADAMFFLCATVKSVVWMQILGTCLLLWGTLFVRGWEVQTYAGYTLTERINQWIYRALYCAGTAVIVFSVTWPACPVHG